MRVIKSISFAGGGAMGAVYPGVHLALLSTGILPNLEHNAGSSAGSIIATMLCVGMPALQFRTLLMKNGIDTLLGKPIQNTSFFKCFVPRCGTPIFTLVHINMNNMAMQFLKMLDYDHLLKIKLQNPNYELTFKDLEVLHKLSPTQFKKLTITATRQDTGELEYFNCNTTPDVGIAKACQASCALPSILDKVTINGRAYFDGGLRNNAPVEGYKKEEVLGVDFGTSLDNQRNHIFQALYASRRNEVSNEKQFDDLLNKILKSILIIKKNLNIKEVLRKHIYELIYTNASQEPLTSAQQVELDEYIEMLDVAIKNQLQSNLTESNLKDKFAAIKENIEPEFYHSKPAFLYLPPPILYRPGLVDILFRDWHIPQYVPNNGGTNCEIKQQTMAKIFSDYALRFIEIRVGNVGTLAFAKSNKFYRVLNAIGFLDATNYITNHEVEDLSLFDQVLFYDEFIDNFIAIYKATLVASGVNYEQDRLLKEVLSNKFLSKREQYYFIRESLEIELQFPWYLFYNSIDHSLNSPQAFALTRAFEYTNHVITDEDLFEEINARKPDNQLFNLFGLLYPKIQTQEIRKELLTMKQSNTNLNPQL
jgi:predicted acylesterase/phospholipase RssA